MKRGLLTINSKRYNNLDNQQIKNRDMNTTKKWSLVAVLCGLFTITLLTACSGGGRVWTEPNNNNNNNGRTETDFVEQTLVFKANRPIEFECIVGGAFVFYVNGVEKSSPYESSSDRDSEDGKLVIPANTEVEYIFKATPRSMHGSTKVPIFINSTFWFTATEHYTDKDANRTPVATTLSFTWKESINGQDVREERKTISLSESNGWKYKSKEYDTRLNFN